MNTFHAFCVGQRQDTAHALATRSKPSLGVAKFGRLKRYAAFVDVDALSIAYADFPNASPIQIWHDGDNKHSSDEWNGMTKAHAVALESGLKFVSRSLSFGTNGAGLCWSHSDPL